MRIKDSTVECNFHPLLTRLLIEVFDPYYREHDAELVITSGSESSTRHRRGSFHYNNLASDIRTHDRRRHGRGTVPAPSTQHKELQKRTKAFCEANNMPSNCFDLILEKTHIHVELHYKGGPYE